ncbi:MAG: GNAT family N-acetyltransferase [Chloroflexi bacterium]|nr:GNAT family N-acetyltransferase [Chloroflexota bacterium]MCI0575953.1 GNAT family N-acetyltransferase [Chloroflexota bacterium]MCI0648140.1 GNAT family N-acetyltransferase [Chloroflexota bacterium]MCI0729590.1 GNAT family N-acetyltransferase [Chloroflexota bacterium]
MEWQKGKFLITNDPQRVNLDLVCELLAQSYWAPQRPREIIAKSIHNSLCFSVYQGERPVGFARVVTDRATFAWICDVIIHPDFRGHGLGKWLMACVVAHPDLQGTQQILKTRDAHSLYERYGFERHECMRRRG